MSGKAYANRKRKADRPPGDFYVTPRSLVWVAKKYIEEVFHKFQIILDPCCGSGAISEEVQKLGYTVKQNDLYRNKGVDYLARNWADKQVIANPPFSQWDAFVMNAKAHAERVMLIGRLNYLGTHKRNTTGVWGNLKYVLCFDRYVDYRTPPRPDGHFHVGAMATAWFVWDCNYSDSPMIKILDVQKYATLGNLV